MPPHPCGTQPSYIHVSCLHEGMMNWGSVLPANPSFVYLRPKRPTELTASRKVLIKSQKRMISLNLPCSIVDDSCRHTIAHFPPASLDIC